MESDRELLALAAKAADLPVDMSVEIGIGWFAFGYSDEDGEPQHWWNPLKSDGDAFRLLVSLNLGLTVGTKNAIAWLRRDEFRCETLNDDSCSATRRAIVRAAAELGKEMK